MDARRVRAVYQEYVVAHGLERSTMLEALATRLPESPSVLYPGCFVHVTPSFHFQHVVYVDRNEMAADFFGGLDAVVSVVEQRKRYPQRPYIRFLEADYGAPLPLPEAGFDLVLALSSGSVARACAKYLKPGGVLLADDALGDARRAAEVPELELRAVMEDRRGKMHWVEGELGGYLQPAPTPAGMRPSGPRFVRRADYYVFYRKRPASSGHRR